MSAKLSFFVLILALMMGCHHTKHQYQGYVEAETLYLAIPFSGLLQTMHVQRGAHVQKGQLLFDIDPNPQAFGLEQAKANLKRGEETWIDLTKPKRIPEVDAIRAQIAQVNAQISLAAIRVKRNQILFDKRVMDRDTLDSALEHLQEVEALKQQYEANLALALLGARSHQKLAQQAENVSLSSSLAQAKWNLAQKQIYAPAEGDIFDTYYKQGEFVSAERPVASLLTRANTRIEFFVPLSDLHDLAVGQKITYFYLNTKDNHTAIIDYISPKAEYMPPLVYSRDNFDKIVFRVKASVRGNNSLISGEPVTVIVESAHGQ